MTGRLPPRPAASPQLGLPKHAGEKTDPNMVIANPAYVNRKDAELEQRVDAKLAEVRDTLDAAAREAAAEQAAKEHNGKPVIPANWAPFLLVGSAISAGLITITEMMPNDVPRICMVIGSFGLTVFGPLLAASPGLRKGVPKQ